MNDHFSKLTSRMFPDSEIACEYSCDQTKATHIAYTIASDSVKGVKQDVASTKSFYSLATDGSSDKEGTFPPVLTNHEDKNTGLVTTSFLDMPVVNLADDRTIYEAMSKSLHDVCLDLQQCLAFRTDNVSVMTSRHNDVLGILQRDNNRILGVGCPCHLSALAAKKGGKCLTTFDPEISS